MARKSEIPPDILEFVGLIDKRIATLNEALENKNISDCDRERLEARKEMDASEAIAWRLVRDDRMTDVWAWYSRAVICPSQERDSLQPDRIFAGAKNWGRSLWFHAMEAARLPGKPTNMSPKQRESYFEKVRRHTDALLELLSGTRFDCSFDEGRLLVHDMTLEEYIYENFIEDAKDIGSVRFIDSLEHHVGHEVKDAISWTKSEDCEHLIAFNVDCGNVTQLPWDYPTCHIRKLLLEVSDWADQETMWQRGIKTAKPIRMSDEGAAARYFNCSMYEHFLFQKRVKIPFNILATLANVVLDQPRENEIDEDTARKQVSRLFERTGCSMDPAPWPDGPPF